MSESRLGLMAELATATAAVTYPIAKVVSGYVERRRIRNALRYSAAVAGVESRLTDRCTHLEERLAHLERKIEKAA
jgi:hypothetical protein